MKALNSFCYEWTVEQLKVNKKFNNLHFTNIYFPLFDNIHTTGTMMLDLQNRLNYSRIVINNVFDTIQLKYFWKFKKCMIFKIFKSCNGEFTNPLVVTLMFSLIFMNFSWSENSVRFFLNTKYVQNNCHLKKIVIFKNSHYAVTKLDTVLHGTGHIYIKLMRLSNK